MLASLDIETQGLHAGRYITGGIRLENGYTFITRNKQELWNKILYFAERERKCNRNLIIYAHNAIYDVLGVVPITDPKFIIHKHQGPHISEYGNISFHDTYGLFKMPLADVGELIGLPKGKTPEWLLKDEHTPTDAELIEAEGYLRRDLEIPLKAIAMLKAELRKHGMRPRKLVTRGQIAKSYVIKRLKECKWTHKLFLQGRNSSGIPYFAYGKLIPPTNPELIHAAYRGGRVEAFQTGRFDCVTQVDINSQYPYAATQIDFPDLTTERHIPNPTISGFPLQYLITKFGVSTCAVQLPEKLPIGLLQLRAKKDNYTPTSGIVVGTWTHLELKKAILNGHKILHVFESVIWETLPENPLKPIYEHLYQLKYTSTDRFRRQLYKDLLNHSTGKFAQHRPFTTTRFNSVENVERMNDEGYRPYSHIGTDILFMKKSTDHIPPHYCPILSTYITAYGRCMLWDSLRILPTQDVIYSDTDGIIFKHSKRNTEMFKYGEGLGAWKTEHLREPLLVYSKKTYRIGERIKMSGASRSWVKDDEFTKGYVEYKRMVPLTRISSLKDVGSFEVIYRDLAPDSTEPQDEAADLHLDYEFRKHMTDEQLDIILNIANTIGGEHEPTD